MKYLQPYTKKKIAIFKYLFIAETMSYSNLEDLDEINEVLDLVAEAAPPAHRPVRHQRQRVEPFELPDVYFKARFRFSKDGVRRLTALVLPYLDVHTNNNRGKPFSAEQVVCSALNILGCGHFQRMQGDCTTPTTP